MLTMKPSTPFLDAARAEAEQLAQWKADTERETAQAAARRKAESDAAPERARLARQRREVCEHAAREAEQLGQELVAALERYMAHAPNPVAVRVRISNFLSNLLRQKFGDITNNGAPIQDLLTELFPEAT